MESSESTSPNLRNLENKTTMRLIDHQLNPILSPVLAWFGGGPKGPSESEKAAAAAQMKAAEERAQAQQAMMQKQMRDQELAAANQKYNGQLAMGKMEASKAAPGAQVDQNAPDDQAAAARRRQGMRKSILAGESNQGYQSTLG